VNGNRRLQSRLNGNRLRQNRRRGSRRQTRHRGSHLHRIARNSTFTYKTKLVDVKQVARELGVRYLLEGSVRRSGKRIRIAAQLIDAVTTTHIWAERYDRDLTDIFDVQDEITEQVAGAIEPELLKTEGLTAISRTENLTAWDLVRQGMWHFHKVTAETAFACSAVISPGG
jgi:hypothetical protein